MDVTEEYEKGRIPYPADFLAEVISIPKDKPVNAIDFGAATGQIGDALYTVFPEATVHFLEPDARYVTYLEKKFAAKIAVQTATVTLGWSHETNLPSPDAGKPYDLIIMGDSATEMPPAETIVELKRLCSPATQIIAVTRYFNETHPGTIALDRLLTQFLGNDYRCSGAKLLKDNNNYKNLRQGKHLIAEEGSKTLAYSSSVLLSQQEMLYYFRSAWFTENPLERNEALLKSEVIQPLWDWAQAEAMLTHENKLMLSTDITALKGKRKENFIEQAMESPLDASKKWIR